MRNEEEECDWEGTAEWSSWGTEFINWEVAVEEETGYDEDVENGGWVAFDVYDEVLGDFCLASVSFVSLRTWCGKLLT